MATPADIPVMLHEMATVGTAMSLVTVTTWGIILAISNYMPKIVALRTLEQAKIRPTRAKP